MGCDITIVVEKHNNETNRWEAVYKPNKEYLRWAESRLETITQDETLHTKAIFTGEIETIERNMELAQSNVYWLPMYRNYKAFAYLANVKNSKYDPLPFYKCSRTETPSAETLSTEAAELLDKPFSHSLTIYNDDEVIGADHHILKIKNKLRSDEYHSVKAFLTHVLVEPLRELKEEFDEQLRFVFVFSTI